MKQEEGTKGTEAAVSSVLSLRSANHHAALGRQFVASALLELSRSGRSAFRTPPDSARPGVCWHFMDGNLDRDEMIRDLDSMKEAGLGSVVYLEVNVDVPRGPVEALQDWTTREERGVKFYSGIARYRKRFELSQTTKHKQEAERRVSLHLGTVHDMARVRLNGKDLGVVWCAPWRLDVSGAIKSGENQLEIANRWSNRMLGDQGAPDKDVRTLQWESGLLGGREHKAGRYTFATGPGLGKLLPSGLLGPVRLMQEAF